MLDTMSTRRKPAAYWVRRGLLYLVLVTGAGMMLFPFYWAMTNSIKLDQFIYASPPQWWPAPVTFKHYMAALTQIPFMRFFANSVGVSLTITLGNVFFDTLAAYGFAKLRFPGREPIFFLLLMALMVPLQVNLIPLYRIMSLLKWLDTYLALIVPSLTSITGIFLMRQFMQSIPDEILDSARVDGCSEFGVFARIAFPLSLPGTATLVIVTFMAAWNDFLWPRLVTGSNNMFTLPVGLTQLQQRYTSNVGTIMAGTVLTMMPLIIVFLLMQRQFIEGLTAGAVKQ
jgi:ABC-type glycerol-3-phosphate transport system permease component